jgi:hypothetical protein
MAMKRGLALKFDFFVKRMLQFVTNIVIFIYISNRATTLFLTIIK